MACKQRETKKFFLLFLVKYFGIHEKAFTFVPSK